MDVARRRREQRLHAVGGERLGDALGERDRVEHVTHAQRESPGVALAEGADPVLAGGLGAEPCLEEGNVLLLESLERLGRKSEIRHRSRAEIARPPTRALLLLQISTWSALPPRFRGSV